MRKGKAFYHASYALCAIVATAIRSASAAGVVSSGGDMWFDGEYVFHTFTNSGTFYLSADVKADVLLVGGGGGGGASRTGGGGGGGGSMTYKANLDIVAGEHSIVVGVGGAGGAGSSNGTGTAGGRGGNTTAFDLTAYGGGSGATAGSAGGNGASGGGGSCLYSAGTISRKTGGLAAYGAGHGYAGGASTNATKVGDSQYHTHCWAGGGGGAGGLGGDGVCTEEGATSQSTKGYAGTGGIGRTCSITGSAVYYGGGGGGGFADYTYVKSAGTVAGGNGGGGAGSGNSSASAAYDGLPGTDGLGGGGGGGGGFVNAVGNGGKGGDGIVIVRYRPGAARESFDSATAEGAVSRRVSGSMVFVLPTAERSPSLAQAVSMCCSWVAAAVVVRAALAAAVAVAAAWSSRIRFHWPVELTLWLSAKVALEA